MVAAGLAALLAASGAAAQLLEPPPEDLEGVGIEPRLDAALPVDLPFVDQDGRAVTLGGYLAGGRPVLLALAYYTCPMLCNLLVDGMAGSLTEVRLVPGEDFEVVVVSIDPEDTPARARDMRQRALEKYGDETGAGWQFLTGEESAVRSLADAVGFGYRWIAERAEYAHGSGIFLVTPEGRLSRFLSGIRFDRKALRLGLIEASEGTIGSPIDQFVLFCFRYDAAQGRYAPAARRLMSVGGGATVAGLGVFLLLHWRREARRRTRVAS
jgi:protein SCO1/2